MDESILESLEGFDAVWQRVTGRDTAPDRAPDPPERDGTAAVLARFIQEETCAAIWAAALARHFGGEARSLLLRQAADARRHLKRLRAEHFIAAGAEPEWRPNCRALSGKLASLRSLHLLARDRAAAYGREAERTVAPELREMFAAFAGDEARHVRESRQLIIACF